MKGDTDQGLSEGPLFYVGGCGVGCSGFDEVVQDGGNAARGGGINMI